MTLKWSVKQKNYPYKPQFMLTRNPSMSLLARFLVPPWATKPLFWEILLSHLELITAG